MVQNGLSSPKKRLLKLQPGYYAIRYGCDAPNGAIATVGYAPTADEGSFQAIGTRRGGQVVMSASSPMALVFVEDGAATVSLSLFFPEGSADVPVRFDVEKLTGDLPAVNAAIEGPAVDSLVYLSGHVEMIGDTECAAGGWLGQESGNARVEGFAVHWRNRPMTVDISYGCTVAGFGDTPPSLSGGFVGSRKRMAPITSFWMDLKGPDADAYELRHKAAFARSGTLLGKQGERLTGADEKDTLIGLQAEIISNWKSKEPSQFGGVRDLKTYRGR
jgi:hypothetical protein